MPMSTGQPLLTGYCNNGHHEGMKPRNHKDQPLPVCVGLAHGPIGNKPPVRCECKCHSDLDKMFAMVEMERVPQPNPEVIPYVRNYWMPQDDPDYLVAASPDLVDGKVAVGERAVELTPTGRTQKGGLEFWVQRECLKFLETGEADGDGQCTVKYLSETIGKAEDLPPRSPGAIAAVFARWEAVGYALIGKKPARFVALTPVGLEKGLDWCKASLAKKS